MLLQILKNIYAFTLVEKVSYFLVVFFVELLVYDSFLRVALTVFNSHDLFLFIVSVQLAFIKLEIVRGKALLLQIELHEDLEAPTELCIRKVVQDFIDSIRGVFTLDFTVINKPYKTMQNLLTDKLNNSLALFKGFVAYFLPNFENKVFTISYFDYLPVDVLPYF